MYARPLNSLLDRSAYGKSKRMTSTGEQETPRPDAAQSETVDPRAARAAGSHPVAARTLFIIDGESSRRVPLAVAGELTLGRADSADVKLADPSVSRLHARVTFSAGAVRIEDLGSQNGTLIDGERIAGSRLLTSGDVVTLSGVTLIFQAGSYEPAPVHFVDMAQFRRVQVELERATKYFRPLSLAVVTLGEKIDRPRAALVLEPHLRSVDVATWLTAESFAVVLPEASASDAQELVVEMLEALSPFGSPRAGLAACPGDGIDLETLLASAREAAATAKPGEVADASRAFRTLAFGDVSVVVADPVMTRLYSLVERLARSELPVLVCGETGSGKELAARAIHFQSLRSQQPLLAVNCAALQETLLESELFGHERGAFTGADRAKAGLFESASGGTVFLDELGELSLGIQAKLLRALETKRITRVGDTRERAIDIRIVAATHKNLEEEVRAGRFRQDLYFRLNGAVLWLPPLRERRRELPILARAFLADACARVGRSRMVIADAAMQMLSLHEWPGNVRELKNLMEYVVATVQEEQVEPWHLEERLGQRRSSRASSADLPSRSSAFGLKPIQEEVAELERTRMLQSLSVHGWNQTRAAEAIHMPLRTFVTKFKQFDLARLKPSS